MKPKIHTYSCQLPDRVTTIIVEETKSAIIVKLHNTKVGPGLDNAKYAAWAFPIFHKWEQDLRPMVFKNLNGGKETIVILTDPGLGENPPCS